MRCCTGRTHSINLRTKKIKGPNVITFELVTDVTTRFFFVGFYIPPSERTGTTQRCIEDALESRLAGSIPMLIGNLNANLDFLQDRQEVWLASMTEKHGLGCVTGNFAYGKIVKSEAMA